MILIMMIMMIMMIPDGPVVLVTLCHLVEAGPTTGEVRQEVVPHPPVIRCPHVDVIKLRLPLMSSMCLCSVDND